MGGETIKNVRYGGTNATLYRDVHPKPRVQLIRPFGHENRFIVCVSGAS